MIVTPDGHAKILDFGLAKLLEAPQQEPEGISHMETLAKTQAGFVLGTLRYMSPEQARGQAVDHRSDIFSLGIVLYEMVTGQLPFSGSTALDTLHAIAFEETRPMTALRPNLPPSLQRVITRCLRKRAQDRYPDAKELAADLKTVQREIESGDLEQGPARACSCRSAGSRCATARSASGCCPAIVLVAALAVRDLVLLLARSHDLGPGLLMLGLAGLLHLAPHPQPAPAPRPALRRRSRRCRRCGWSRSTACASRCWPTGRRPAPTCGNALLDSINASMFFGDPFTLVIRDEFTPEEEGPAHGPGGPLRPRGSGQGALNRSRLAPRQDGPKRVERGHRVRRFELPAGQRRESQPLAACRRHVARERVDEGQGPGLGLDVARRAGSPSCGPSGCRRFRPPATSRGKRPRADAGPSRPGDRRGPGG